MDTTAQWQHEESGFGKSNNMGELMGSNNNGGDNQKRSRPQEQLNCPRCNSTNTKFCYYNNYSLTQPRYFCKTCRRYWTEGGTLRNVPVGGGSRKNKKPSTSTTTSTNTTSTNATLINIPDLNPPNLMSYNSQGQDLNLGFQSAPAKTEIDTRFGSDHNSSSSAGVNSRLLMYPSGFPLQEFKPSLGNFFSSGSSVDHGLGIGRYNNNNTNKVVQVQDNGGSTGRILFPFGDYKHVSGNNNGEVDHQNKGHGNPPGYWTGLLGGGGSW